MTSTRLKIRTLLVIICMSISLSPLFSAGKTTILKGGSRDVIPLEPGQSAVETIEKYQENKNLSRYRRIDKTEAIPIVKYLHLPESSGTGNISDAPKFVDANAGDFHLQSNSPCIDAGNPGESYNDVDGTRNDIGAYGGPYGDW